MVLVLAIAGLIFLMVFIGLPALQRSQRDSQRRSDMSRMKAAYISYKANNGGRGIQGEWNAESKSELENWKTFFDNYLRNDGSKFEDPDGRRYVAQFGVFGFDRAESDTVKIITVNIGKACLEKPDANNRIITDSEQGFWAARIHLENGGVYCVDLQ